MTGCYAVSGHRADWDTSFGTRFGKWAIVALLCEVWLLIVIFALTSMRRNKNERMAPEVQDWLQEQVSNEICVEAGEQLQWCGFPSPEVAMQDANAKGGL